MPLSNFLFLFFSKRSARFWSHDKFVLYKPTHRLLQNSMRLAAFPPLRCSEEDRERLHQALPPVFWHSFPHQWHVNSYIKLRDRHARHMPVFALRCILTLQPAHLRPTRSRSRRTPLSTPLVYFPTLCLDMPIALPTEASLRLGSKSSNFWIRLAVEFNAFFCLPPLIPLLHKHPALAHACTREHLVMKSFC